MKFFGQAGENDPGSVYVVLRMQFRAGFFSGFLVSFWCRNGSINVNGKTEK
jgi:hypothetical protein